MTCNSKFSRLYYDMELIIYFTKISIIENLTSDITRIIKILSKSFYKKRIQNNLAFSDMIERKSQLESYDQVNLEILFSIMYRYLMEEFYWIWSFPDRDEYSITILEQTRVISEFAESKKMRNYLSDNMIRILPMMIWSKMEYEISFQFKYYVHSFFSNHVRNMNIDTIDLLIDKCIQKYKSITQNEIKLSINSQEFFSFCAIALSHMLHKTNFKVEFRKFNFNIADIIDYMYVTCVLTNEMYSCTPLAPICKFKSKYLFIDQYFVN